MNLKEYLEYLTPQEKVTAFKGGQHGLAGALDPENPLDPKKVIHQQELNPEIEKAKVDFFNQYKGRLKLEKIRKNNWNGGAARICLCHNGNYFTCDPGEANHDMLVKLAYFDYQFPEIKASSELMSWYQEESMMNYFVCLTYNPAFNNKIIGMSESYYNEPTETEMQYNQSLRAHYGNLCQQKFKTMFYPEVIET